MSIHRFLSSGDDNYFHSSDYAKVARGSQIGSMNTQSFSERYRVDRNRKMVQRYHDSHVARYSSRTADTQDTTGRLQQGGVGVPPREHGGSIPPRPPTFHEPPTRSYNPFA